MFNAVTYFTNDQTLKLVLDHVSDYICFIDTHLNYCAISRSFESFLVQAGHKKPVAGQSIYDVHPYTTYLNDFLEHLNTSNGSRFDYQTKIEVAEENYYLDVNVVPSFNPVKELVGYTISAKDVTEQRQMQNTLATEYSLAETIVKNSPDLIFLKSPQGVYLSCNPAFARFVGEPQATILGMTDAVLMSEKSAAYIAERDAKVLELKKAQHNEEWITYNNGDRRLVDMHKVPILSDDGSINGLLGIGRDITSEHFVAREKFQAALLFEVTSDPCLILDEHGNIQAANPALAHSLGYATSALLSKSISLFLYDSNGGAAMKQALESDAWRGELMAIHISGKGLPFMASVNRIPATDRTGGYVIILSDARTASAFKESLLDKAYHDSLTGLPNRLLLNARIEHAMRQSYRHASIVAILFIDLDRFKYINDTYGHHIGDKLLCEVANRLKDSLRQTDTLARLGGDEFVVVLDRVTHQSNVITAVEHLLANLSEEPYTIDGVDHQISASIGVSIYPNDATNSAKLLELADIAMYRAKRSGRNQYCIQKCDSVSL